VPIDKELLKAIKEKKEKNEELTDAEVALLSVAEQEEEEEPSNTGSPKSWEEAFAHPRFKALVADKKKAEDALILVEKNKKDAELKALADNQEFEVLYNATKKDLETAAEKAQLADTYEDVLKKTLDAEILTLHADAKSLIPESLSTVQKLQYISTNRTLLEKRTAGDIGSGKRNLGSGSSNKNELTAEQKVYAKKFGVSESEYLKYSDGNSGVNEEEKEKARWYGQLEDVKNDKDL